VSEGSRPRTGEHPDHHVFVDAEDDDWAWRRRIRANPALALPYRIAVLVVGLAITVGGLVLVPLPGPGWLIVFTGVAVLASEFEPAQRLLEWGRDVLRRWTEWVKAQPVLVQGVVGLVTAAFVVVVLWGLLRLSGVPGFLPDAVEAWLHAHAGL